MFFALTTFGSAASFDCSKATTETEVAICGDPELSALDELMGIVYKQALRSNDWRYNEEDRVDATIISTQRTSLVTQQKCQSDKDCLKVYYTLRIKDLLDVTGHDSYNSNDDLVSELLEFLEYLSDRSDIRSIVISEVDNITALYISDGDPDKISRGNTGTVYNYNSSQLLIAYIDADKVQKIALIEGPSDTSLGAYLSVYDGKVTLNEELTRGWSSTSYSYIASIDKWVLSRSESKVVTSPGLGLYHQSIIDFSMNVVITKFGYVFADCDIQIPPTLIGDYYTNFRHIVQMPGYDKDLSPRNGELREDHFVFLQGLHDRDLYAYSAAAFEYGNFNLSVTGFEMLNQRVQTVYKKRISEGSGEKMTDRFPQLVQSVFDCVKSTAAADKKK